MEDAPGTRGAAHPIESADPFLEVRGVTKTYGPTVALADVSLTVGAGEIVALAGENGSGKSTLARIVAGSLQPDGGELLIDGEPVVLRSPRDALRAGIAIVSQEVTSIPDLSVAENVFLTRLTRLTAPFHLRQLVEEARPLLRRAGVSVDPRVPFSSLRIGDRERVEIARAMASKPRLLILDEATSRLGENDVDRLFVVLRQLRDEGTSSIIITHRLREMTSLADRAVVLRDGRFVGELPKAQLTEIRLATTMVGRGLGDLYPRRAARPLNAAILQVRDLVVDGTAEPVSFSVHAGEVVCLSGLVGSGRSELLETIAGLRPSANGDVSVGGIAVRPGSVRRALDAGIVLVPEDRHRHGLVIGASIQSNIAMGEWRITRIRRAEQDRRCAVAGVRRLAIKTRSVELPVEGLSGGNQQRVVMARVLAAKPKVLLLDEPARGIDIAAKAAMFALVNEVVEHGVAVVMASSEMLETLGMADRIIVLHERRFAGELGRADATEERLALLAAGGGPT